MKFLSESGFRLEEHLSHDADAICRLVYSYYLGFPMIINLSGEGELNLKFVMMIY